MANQHALYTNTSLDRPNRSPLITGFRNLLDLFVFQTSLDMTNVSYTFTKNSICRRFSRTEVFYYSIKETPDRQGIDFHPLE